MKNSSINVKKQLEKTMNEEENQYCFDCSKGNNNNR